MATVSPNLQRTAAGIPYILWDNIVTGDTILGYAVQGRLANNASIQIGGTFGGTTAKVQISNDGVTYLDLKDVNNTAVSATADAIFEVSTSAVYIRPVLTGGTGNAVDVTLVLRGPVQA